MENEFEIIIFGSRIFHIFPILQRVIMFSLVYIFEQRGSPASFGAGAQSGERQRRGFGINSLILSAGFYRWPAIFVVAVCSRMISLLAHFLRSVSRNFSRGWKSCSRIWTKKRGIGGLLVHSRWALSRNCFSQSIVQLGWPFSSKSNYNCTYNYTYHHNFK